MTDFQVGDVVNVVKKVQNPAGPSWIDTMDKFVGTKQKIRKKVSMGVIFQTAGFIFPKESIRPVEISLPFAVKWTNSNEMMALQLLAGSAGFIQQTKTPLDEKTTFVKFLENKEIWRTNNTIHDIISVQKATKYFTKDKKPENLPYGGFTIVYSECGYYYGIKNCQDIYINHDGTIKIWAAGQGQFDSQEEVIDAIDTYNLNEARKKREQEEPKRVEIEEFVRVKHGQKYYIISKNSQNTIISWYLQCDGSLHTTVDKLYHGSGWFNSKEEVNEAIKKHNENKSLPIPETEHSLITTKEYNLSQKVTGRQVLRYLKKQIFG